MVRIGPSKKSGLRVWLESVAETLLENPDVADFLFIEILPPLLACTAIDIAGAQTRDVFGLNRRAGEDHPVIRSDEFHLSFDFHLVQMNRPGLPGDSEVP